MNIRKRKSFFNLFLVVSIIFSLYSCGGSGGGSSGQGYQISNNKTIFSLAETPDQLEMEYRNIPIYKTINIGFTKPLKIPQVRGKSPENHSTDITDLNWVKLLDESGKEIPIHVRMSEDRLFLEVIPINFLKPSTIYTLIVYGQVTSEEGETLKKTISFSVRTLSNSTPLTISGPGLVLEGKEVEFSLSTGFEPSKIVWDMDVNSAEDRTVNGGTSVYYVYDSPGDYRIKAVVVDKYGRSLEAEKMVTVLNDSEKLLKNTYSGFSYVDTTSIDELQNSELKESLGEMGEYVFSIAEGNYEAGQSSQTLFAISMKSDEIGEFYRKYLNLLEENGKLLGIVSFNGFPAILSYSSGNGNYKLNLLVSDNHLNLDNITIGGKHYYDIHIPQLNSIPMLYFTSINIDESAINVLKEKIPSEIRGELPIIYSDNGSIYLGLPESFRGTRSIVSWFVSKCGKPCEIIDNIVSSAVYDALKKFKSYFLKIKQLNPFENIGAYRDACQSIKADFLQLYNQFKDDPSHIYSSITDPDRAILDLKSFLYRKNGVCIKSAISNVLNEVESRAQYINGLLNSFASHIGESYSSYISTFIPDTKSDSSIYISCSINKCSLSMKNGAKSYSISLSILQTFQKYSSAFSKKVGDNFPISFIVNSVNQIKSKLPSGMAGFFYYSNNHELRFLMKLNSTSGKRCEDDTESLLCFGGYLYSGGVKGELSANISPSTGILLYLQPSSITFPYSDDAGTIYKFLSKSTQSFPEIGFNIHTKYRNNYVEIKGSTLPAIGLSAGVEFGLKFNYHILFGGEGKVAINLSVGVSPSAFAQANLDTIEGIIKGAFQSTKQLMGISPITVDNSSVEFHLPDDKAFINFVDSFLTNIENKLTQQGLQELSNSITFGISLGGELAGGVGAGGTGTGGASANLKLEGETGMEFDLTSAIAFFNFIKVSNVNSFIITPMRNLSQFFGNIADEPSGIFTKIFELYRKTFSDMLNNINIDSSNYGDQLFKTLSEHMGFSLCLNLGAEAEAEEVGTVRTDVSQKPCISVNGETLFNILYSLFGNPQNVRYLDHAGIYPQITLSFPVSAELKAGFDEGIEVVFKGGLQADFITATITIKNDPFIDYGVHHSYITLKFPLSVKLSPSETTVYPWDTVQFNCTASKNGAGIRWFVEGIEVNGATNLVVDGTRLVTVESVNNNSLVLKDFFGDKVSVICMATDEKGEKAFDYATVYTVNTLTGTPKLYIEGSPISDGAVIDGNSISVVGVSSSANKPLQFIVEISETPDFNRIYKAFIVQSPFYMPEGLRQGKPYYIRVKGTNGYNYTDYSSTKKIYASLPRISLIQPSDGEEVCSGGVVVFKGSYTVDGADQLSSLNPVVEISQDEGFTNISTTLRYGSSGFEQWRPTVPGIYYWRIKGQVGSTTVSSSFRTIKVKPAAPDFLYPKFDEQYYFNHREVTNVKLKSIEGAQSYEIEMSNNISFNNILWDSGPTNSPNKQLTLPTYNDSTAHYLYLRARVKINGIWGCWTTHYPEIQVQNHPPIASNEAPATPKEVCINGKVTTAFSVDPDLDGDNITAYEVRVYKEVNGTKQLVKSERFNQNISNIGDMIEVSLSMGHDIGYGKRFIAVVAYDKFGSHIDYNKLFSSEAGGWSNVSFTVKNCPPPAPEVYGPDNNSNLFPGNVVTLTAKKVVDPDNDNITGYQFVLIGPEGNQQSHTVQFSNYNYATTTFTVEEAGNYTWKVRAMSDFNGTEQYSDWSSGSFQVKENPTVSILYPPNGALVVADNLDYLKISVNLVGDDVRAQYQYAYNPEFESAKQSAWSFYNAQKEGKSYFNFLPPNFEDNSTIYWRARGAVENNPTSWSETYCFTYHPILPSKIEVEGSEVYYSINGSTTLQFDVHNSFTNCLGDNGTFEYKICSDESCYNELLKGNFVPGKPFTVNLEPGDYYFKATQVVQNVIDNDDKNQIELVSDPVGFNVQSKNADGLIGYWTFDNCTGENEVEGVGDAEIIGSPTCTETTAKGKSFYLKGESYLKVTNSDMLDLQRFTITAWIMPDEVDGEHTIAGRPEQSGYGVEVYKGKLRGYMWMEGSRDYVYVTSQIGLPKDKWTFVALTYDGNNLKLYQNGKLAASKNVEGTVKENDMPFLIGANPTSSGGAEMLFKGYIDEVRLYSKSLTEDEIKSIMVSDGANMTGGIAPDCKLTVSPDSGTQPFNSVLTCNSSCEGCIYTWDWDGDGMFDNETERDNITAKYKEAGKIQPAVIISAENSIYNWETAYVYVEKEDKSLILYWSFDRNVRDYSGNGYSGTIYGSPKWVDGKDLKAILLDNYTNYVGLNIPEKGISLSKFTLSFWVKLSESAEDINMFVQGSNEGGNNEFNFGWKPDNETFQVCLGDDCKYSNQTFDLNDKNWHKLKYVFDSRNVYIYVDDDNRPFDEIEFSISQPVTIHYLVIGEDQDNDNGGGFDPRQALYGTIDELKLYDDIKE